MNLRKKPLFILEMANNHMGDVAHGIRMIEEFGRVCQEFKEFEFAFKFQYRDLKTFIHPSMQGRQDVKLIKRFEETVLNKEQFGAMIAEGRKWGFQMICTPFDEVSVDRVIEDGFDFVKVASCSITDWPLLEKIAKSVQKPLIVSTAGASMDEVDRVMLFLTNRQKDVTLMHCVAEYPTQDEDLKLDRLIALKNKFQTANVGFSTHESPQSMEPVMLALAAGARVFEKHVGLKTEQYAINGYSATPEQVQQWLRAAQRAWKMLGEGKVHQVNSKEQAALFELRRGAWLNKDLAAGSVIEEKDLVWAFPPQEGQLLANHFSKYEKWVAKVDLRKDARLFEHDVQKFSTTEKIQKIGLRIKELETSWGVHFPRNTGMEISHHYGLDQFFDHGLIMFTLVNREYCKKMIVLLKDQKHPEQYHEKKEETFLMIKGEMEVSLVHPDGKRILQVLRPGDVLTVERGVRHSFKGLSDCLFEEISTNHAVNDSFYTDESIGKNKQRKTYLNFWYKV